MTPLHRHLAAAAYNNAWANHRLLKACAQLSDADFAATRTSFFPSIRATLNHILTVDWYYVECLERSLAGQPPHEDAARHFRVDEPFETCAALAVEQRAVDRRLVALCEGLTEASFDIAVEMPRQRGLQRDRLDRILAHLFQHQVHHRGQAHAMLAGTAVKPPQLDEFYCSGEAHLRAQDLAELGYSEAQIWDRQEPARR
jgi:uncharacterized damage-inducible protein DinB